jgi:hypothetical protein
MPQARAVPKVPAASSATPAIPKDRTNPAPNTAAPITRAAAPAPVSALAALPASPWPAPSSYDVEPDPFGPPPLIAGEDAAAYDAFLARATAVVEPADFLEEMWVRDAVDLGWEVFRLRRLKAELVTASADEGLEALLGGVMPPNDASDLACGWAARHKGSVRKVEALLRRAGLGRAAVTARTLALHVEEIAQIDHMIALAEARRDGVLREVERHRVALSRALRGAVMIAAPSEPVPADTPAADDDDPYPGAPRWDRP